MREPLVVIGIGEMGAVFARGFLRSGHPVYPVTRGHDMALEAKKLPDPALVLVAVAENDLHPVLEQMPAAWRTRVGLLQNELLAADWHAHAIDLPTVAVVWFEKKKGQDVKVLLPSPVYGPQASCIAEALQAIDIPARILDDEEQLEFELVRKNVYILTTNICGLVTGGTVGELWDSHQSLARAVAGEVMDIQFALIGRKLSRDRLIEGMLEAFDGDPDHKCMGRSAPGRLARALANADRAGLNAPKLYEIQLRAQPA